MLIENAVVYMKSTLFTKSYVQNYFPSLFYGEDCCCLHEKYIVYKELCPEVFSFAFFMVRIVIVYMYSTFFTNI